MLKHQVGEVSYMVPRLYPGCELPQFKNWLQRNGNKWTPELTINWTESNQDDAGQTTSDQFKYDC